MCHAKSGILIFPVVIQSLPMNIHFAPKLRRTALLIIMLFAGALVLGRSDIQPGDVGQQVRRFTRAIEFDYAGWALDALALKARQAALGVVDYIPEAAQKQLVLDYLELVREIQQNEGELNRIYADPAVGDPESASVELRARLDELYNRRDFLAPLAESVLQGQLNAIAAEAGLTLGGQTIPPALYHVTPLPLALIVSPRDRIEQIADISLQPGMTAAERDVLETQVDEALDVSSLVVNVGGVGLYPTMVMQTTNINWLAEVIAHEWTHNYLTLRPLGASYMSSPELRIMNETTANIAGKELGAALIERYYPEFAPPPSIDEPVTDAEPAAPPEPPIFDFRAEMYKTRVHVDEMLAAGEIEKAEIYMEIRRRVFWDHGYHIRKLNQAYFAFYGAYADQPGGAAGAKDPIGAAVRTLRANSDSLAEFVNRMSWLWSFDQLQEVVEGLDVPNEHEQIE